MSNWQVGDLAVCVDARKSPTLWAIPLVEGHTYRVAALVHAKGAWSPCNGMHGDMSFGLRFVEADTDAPYGFHPARFRKIRPDEHEGNAEDWQILRESHKRKVSA